MKCPKLNFMMNEKNSKQNEFKVLHIQQHFIYLLSVDDSNAITHRLSFGLSVKFAYARFYLFIDSSFFAGS